MSVVYDNRGLVGGGGLASGQNRPTLALAGNTAMRQMAEEFFKFYGKGAKRDFPKFDGKSPGVWIWKFKLTAGHNRITESEMCRRVSGCMEGAANIWFLATFNGTLSSFPEFEAKFKEWWDCDNSIHAVTRRLTPARQQEEQSGSAFAHGIKNINNNLVLEKSVGPYPVERSEIADKGLKRPTVNPIKGTDQKIKAVHRRTVAVSSPPPPSLPPLPKPNEILQPIPAPPILFEPITLPPEIIPNNYLIFVMRAEDLAHFIGHSLAFLRSSQKEFAKRLPTLELQEYSPKPGPFIVKSKISGRCDDYLLNPSLVQRYVYRPVPRNNYSKVVINRQTIDKNFEIKVYHQIIESSAGNEANHQRLNFEANCVPDSICGNVDRPDNELLVNSGQRFRVDPEPHYFEHTIRAIPFPNRKRSTRRPHIRFKGFLFDNCLEPYSLEREARAPPPPKGKRSTHRPHTRFKGFIFLVLLIVFIIYLKLIFCNESKDGI